MNTNHSQKIIPTGWQKVKLADCVARRPDYGINAAATQYSDLLPAYLRITDISEDGRFLPEKKSSVNHVNSKNYILNVGDIVVARTGASVGKSYLYNTNDGQLIFAGFLIRIKPDKSKLVSEFLSAYLHTLRYSQWVKETSTRSGQPGINSGEYSNLSFFLPPLPEQKRIVAMLETWDKAIEKLAKKIEIKKEVKNFLVQYLFTGEKRLHGFNEDWKTVQLQDICRVIMGQSPSSVAYNEFGNGIPLIQGNNDIKNRKTVDRVWTTEITKTADAGNIIMTVRAPVGCIGIATKKYALAVEFARFKQQI